MVECGYCSIGYVSLGSGVAGTYFMSALASTRAVREISVVSLAEIALKEARGRLTFHKEDVALGIADLRLRISSYTADHAYNLFDLPFHHADPFERQVGEMVNEVLDLHPASFSESLYAAIIDGVGLDQDGIELVLAKAQGSRGYLRPRGGR